jgi:hypothetical protein
VQESITKQIALEDDDPLSVEQMVEYFYRLDYSDGSPAHSVGGEHLQTPDVLNSEMLAAAADVAADADADVDDKSLDDILTSSQRDLASDDTPKGFPLLLHAQMYAMGEKYQIIGLKSLAKSKFEVVTKENWHDDMFSSTVDQIYKSTPNSDRGLRDIMVDLACQHIASLELRQDFQEMLESLPLFTLDLLRKLILEKVTIGTVNDETARIQNIFSFGRASPLVLQQ